jgi:GNAT superfamily N-acetyltransferase
MSGAWLADPWLARMYRSFSVWLDVATASGEGARVLRPEGVRAAIAPGAPERSFFNSVIYETPEALAAAYPEVAAAYGERGCAWTVWVPEADRDSAALLASAGHRLDARPRAMVMDLDRLTPPDPAGLDWRSGADPRLAGRINDVAYGYEIGTFERAVGTPPETIRLCEARVEGETMCVAGTIDHDGDCSVWLVATLPEARGKGLAGRLLHQALAEARDRGCTTSTLQATKLGRPVYDRLGYSDIGELEMWELRE